MTDTITLTREEVREARRKMLKCKVGRCPHFLDRQPIPPYQSCIDAEDAYCRLCKRLTEFARKDAVELLTTLLPLSEEEADRLERE